MRIRTRSGDARPDDRQRMRPAGADARRRAARAVAGAAVASLAAGTMLVFGALPASADSFTVDDAVFAWGISNEANNRAFAPGTYNLMSAGVAPKTSGADTISESEWAATSGDVTIQKRSADGSYATATWEIGRAHV